MTPSYTVEDIRFGTDDAIWEQAVGLYERGKVKRVSEDASGYQGTVSSTQDYAVSVSARHFDEGECTCYLGTQVILCKHLVALAIWAVRKGATLGAEEKRPVGALGWSGRVGTLSVGEQQTIKEEITFALRLIKPYGGPSRTWFRYQAALDEGCRRLSASVSRLPAGRTSANIMVGLLLRLERKLSGGVDDSDGSVGGFME